MMGGLLKQNLFTLLTWQFQTINSGGDKAGLCSQEQVRGGRGRGADEAKHHLRAGLLAVCIEQIHACRYWCCRCISQQLEGLDQIAQHLQQHGNHNNNDSTYPFQLMTRYVQDSMVQLTLQLAESPDFFDQHTLNAGHDMCILCCMDMLRLWCMQIGRHGR